MLDVVCLWTLQTLALHNADGRYFPVGNPCIHCQAPQVKMLGDADSRRKTMTMNFYELIGLAHPKCPLKWSNGL